MSQRNHSETGLFAIVSRIDDRLTLYGLEVDKQLLLTLNTFDKAHCVMLYEQGIIQKAEAVKILKVLKNVDELGPEGFPWGKGDLWVQKERFVIGKIGEDVGGKLHTGRSRQDVGATTNRIHLRTRVLDMAEKLNELREALLVLAVEHIETVMPCYTWMQHAQPTTFAHYLLSFSFALARDYDRFFRSYQLINRSPAGAALQTGTSHPLNRHRTKELLGFDEVIRNTRDASMNFDYLLDIMVAASSSALDLLRMLEELTVWHSAEFNMIALDDCWCGTSSIMPQKRNPYPFMTIRGKASRVFAHTMQVFSTLESPVLGPASPAYLQADMDQVIEEVLGIFILAAGFLPTLRVNKTLMRERAAMYWAQATDLADAIVREKGLSFRTAHHIVAELVRKTTELGKGPADVTSKTVDQAAVEVTGKPLALAEDTVSWALDPSLAVRNRKVYGATAPEDVQAQIKESRGQLELEKLQIETSRKKIEEAQRRLDEAIQAIIEVS